MSDKLYPVPLPRLISLALQGIRRGNFMGIPGKLFFRPDPSDPFRTSRFGRILETPLGVAAGPHSQMSQNIVAAWLCGARYIELKTIQTLDELKVTKPCIDMHDEGYNCEWSQELKIRESFREYLNAWIAVHILNHALGFGERPGVIFNMSVGYNLEGIQKENVQWFLEKMSDCSAEIQEARKVLSDLYPPISALEIPACISDNVTLSTMHGCPPDEIGRIARYLLAEKGLHTAVKLNPTLLGPDELRRILNGTLGFKTEVPDEAFAHDLKYPDAVEIIRSMSELARGSGLTFSVKLTNTLECLNRGGVFDPSENMMYMSGRALHPISIRLADRLQRDFDGDLDISFSAGVDCFNFPEVIACGLGPATVCSDLLKPGGYGRLHQYIENLEKAMKGPGASDIAEFVLHSREGQTGRDLTLSGDKPAAIRKAALGNLSSYAERTETNTAYHRDPLTEISIRTERPLGWFDCIHAPCKDTCPAGQDIPEYMYYTSQGDLNAAKAAVTRTNPFPSVTGMICDHPCQQKCTRVNYDEPLRIREIKRFIAENAPRAEDLAGEGKKCSRRVAIIGAGPAGLSCGWFLRSAGCEVHIFEKGGVPGGMVSAAIPAFRLTAAEIGSDIGRVLASGVVLHENSPVGKVEFEEMNRTFDAIFLAAGAQRSVKPLLEGADATGVLDPLEFLFAARRGENPLAGNRVVIIGGGNTAMDAARTAFRLAGENGSVTVAYRRTRREMPADKGEVSAVIDEGISIVEQVKPLAIETDHGVVSGLACCRTSPGLPGKDGRAVPIDIPGSEFTIPCDVVIPAIGQEIDLDFLTPGDLLITEGKYKTALPGLFIGGDALRGASTAINAIGDGRKAAEEILRYLGTGEPETHDTRPAGYYLGSPEELLVKRAERKSGIGPHEIPVGQRRNFDLVTFSLGAGQAAEEASRCLQCDVICNICVSVCPNLANFSYQVAPRTVMMQKAVRQQDDSSAFIDDEVFSTEQSYQVLNIRDLCNECGNCTTFCPSSGRPYADKPGLCLSVETLNKEESGFCIVRGEDRTTLVFKEQGHVRTLMLSGGLYTYETDQVRAVIDPVTFGLRSVRFLTPCVKEFRFGFAAEMSVILEGLMNSEL